MQTLGLHGRVRRIARAPLPMGKTLSLAVTLLFGASAAALAQAPATGRITGTCSAGEGVQTEAGAQEPVVGATVRLVGTSYTGVTDGQGQFGLALVPQGQYVLEARRIGYRPSRQAVRVLPNAETKVALHMGAVPATVDAVVVEALVDQGQRTFDLSSLQKVPLVGTANVTAVTLREIKLVHAKDAWDLVRQATGVEVHEQGQGPGFASDAVIRGFTSDHSSDVAIMVDGVPVNEPINGHGEGYADWNLLFPAALADVQVIKGPISPLFGNFSTGGAINVTTQASTEQTSFQAEGGSNVFGASTFTTGLERGPWGAFLGAHGVHNGGWRDNSAYDAGQVIARVNRHMSATLLLDAGLQYYGTKWNSPGFLSLGQFNAGDLTPAADPTDGGDKQRFQGRISAVVNQPNFQWSTTAWGYGSHWHLFLTIPELGGEGEGTGAQTEELDNRGAGGVRSIVRWTRGTVELTLGAEAQRQQSAYSIWQTIARQRDITRNQLKATFMDEAGLVSAAKTFARLFRVEGGLRVDALQPTTNDLVTRLPRPAVSHVVWQPKAGAVLYARSNLQFYGSAARGFRNAPGTITDPTKPPMTAWAFEGGTRFALTKLDGSLAFFRLETRNEWVYNPVTLQNETTGRSLREGVEADLKARPMSRLELAANFTFNTKGIFYLTDTVGQGAAASRLAAAVMASAALMMHDVGNTGDVAGVAHYSGRAGITIQPTVATWISTWVTVMGPYVPLGEPDSLTTAFAITNVQVGARLNRRIELTLGLDNLLNQRAPELRASGAVNPMAPRTVHLNANTRW
jgi:outer membrane receptor protein involved in Fe transport